MKVNKKDVGMVRDYWNLEACGSHFVKKFKSLEDFYTQYENYRYKVEWHIPELIPFNSFSGKEVLEIGCGNGIDGSMFAKNGANYTGVDLTTAAIDATRRLFQIKNLNGKFQVENAECLSFADDSFNLVYSHGVIHHSPKPALIIHEVNRVLKPGGRVIVMLYHKNSFNYYCRIMVYMRLRLLLKIACRIFRIKKDRKKFSVQRSTFIAGTDTRLWDAHYSNFLEMGWTYLKAKTFVHRCTDGPDCPYAWVYTKRTAKALFSEFKVNKMEVAHLPLKNSKFGKYVPIFVERIVAQWFGFYLFVFAEKPKT